MKNQVKVAAGVLVTAVFIFAGILSIRAGISSIENIIAIALATTSFVLASISGAITHHKILESRGQTKTSENVSLQFNKNAA